MATGDKHIDPAALVVASLAGILALSTKPGEYDLLALMTSGTLVLILIAYSGRSDRSPLQSFAYGAVIGLCSTEGVGFIMEWLVNFGVIPPTPPEFNEEIWKECQRQLQPLAVNLTETCKEISKVSEAADSRVSATAVKGGGVLIGLVWISYDLIRQKKLKKKAEERKAA